jgi:hypothetical protein
VRLLRFSRRETIRNVEAAIVDIVRKTLIDHHRRQSRWEVVAAALRVEIESTGAPGEANGEALADCLGDPIERTRFIVLGFFRDRSPRCHDLAAHYFDSGSDWVAVARRSGRSGEAVRQQWSRCVSVLRNELRRDQGVLWRWNRGVSQ